MVQIYKPTAEVVHQLAAQARAREKERKEDRGGNFRWGDIKDGEIVLRALPPTNSRGMIGRRIGTHYFMRTSLDKLMGDSQSLRCLAVSHPEVEGVRCPICDVGDKLLAQYPALEISRWHKPAFYDYIQAIDRKESPPVVRLYKFTPALFNWLILQMESLLQQNPPIDMTDLMQGIDFKITKSTSKTMRRGKEFTNTKYEKTLWAITGPTPVTSDQAVLNSIVSSMYDFDEVWKYPSDDKLTTMHKAAADIYSFYVKKQYDVPGVQMQVPGTYTQTAAPQQPFPVQLQLPIGVAPSVSAAPIQAAPATSAAPVQLSLTHTGAADYQATIAAMQQQIAQMMAQQGAKVVESPSIHNTPTVLPAVAPAATAVSAPTHSVTHGPAGTPTDRPPCFGGSSARSAHPNFSNIVHNGGLGYSEDSELCLTCKYELACMDACKEKGVYRG